MASFSGNKQNECIRSSRLNKDVINDVLFSLAITGLSAGVERGHNENLDGHRH